MRRTILVSALSGALMVAGLGAADKKSHHKKETTTETASTTTQTEHAAPAGDAAKGKETFEQCGVCHSVDTDEKKMGPSLKGLFKKAKMTNGKKPTDENVKTKINQGGNGMPSYADMLTDEEKTNLLAYLHTV